MGLSGSMFCGGRQLSASNYPRRMVSTKIWGERMNRIIDELKLTRQVDQTVCRGCDETRTKKDVWRRAKKKGEIE